MVCNDTGRAYATLDLTGAHVDRFLFADQVSEIAAQWRDRVMKDYF